MSQVVSDPAQPGQAPQAGQEPDAAPQQPAAGGADAPNPQDPPADTVARAELEKVIGERQAAKDRARQAEDQMAALNEKLAAMPSAEDLQTFQEWKAQQDDATRQAAIKKGDAEALEKRVREPLQRQINAKDERIGALQAQLTNLLRDQALRTAAEECGAHQPMQVVGLLRARVQMKPTETGEFRPQFLDADGQPQYDGNAQRVDDPKTFVGLYLGLPENANLVRAQVNPGAGARPPGGGGGTTNERLPQTMEEFNALPDDERMTLALEHPDLAKRLAGIVEPSTQGFL